LGLFPVGDEDGGGTIDEQLVGEGTPDFLTFLRIVSTRELVPWFVVGYG
jgi:hypothetical protein